MDRFAMLRTTVLALACLASQLAAAASLTVRLTDAAGAPLADAVIYAVPTTPVQKAPAPGEVEQVAKTFRPLVTVVQTGAAVAFPNRDTVKHQIYSFSPAKIFQLKLYAGLPAAPIVFDKPGLVVLGCNIHDRMIAYILVVDTPYFGKSAADGIARIDGLPAGDYRLTTWHPGLLVPLEARAIHVAGDIRLDTVLEVKT